MSFIKKLILFCSLVWACATTTFALAEGIKLRQIQFEPIEQSWVTNASYQIDFPNELTEAVKKGITLRFVTELNVTRGRWYWFEEKPISAVKYIKLSFQPLTQVYRVNVGSLTLSATTLEEALVQVWAIAGWQVADLSALDNGRIYEGSIRMRLDLSQLPKPFQINALNSKEWNISSDWYAFEINPKIRPLAK